MKDMIDLFGDSDFAAWALGARLLLDACARTLESVALLPSDQLGEWLSMIGTQVLANNFPARRPLMTLIYHEMRH